MVCYNHSWWCWASFYRTKSCKISNTPMKCQTPTAIEFNLFLTCREQPWLVALMKNNSLLQLSEGDEKTMILKKFLNNESLKYFLHETSRLNLEGMLKRGMIWPCVALCKLCDLQIWGRCGTASESLWLPFLLLEIDGQRGGKHRGAKGASAIPFLLPGHYCGAGGGERRATGYKSAAKGERGMYDYQSCSPLPLNDWEQMPD